MYNGVLNIYKEAGFTSHDVVAKLRGILKQKKIGHTGTLDPDAVGVLPVCLGKATKVCDMLTDERKTYRAVLRLGVTTDTQDMSGQVMNEHPVECSDEETRACVESFLGDQMQVPPMYSALKINGKKLYELAREGKTVERQPRPVTFYDITICQMSLPTVTLLVTCSKGTYIRTLCHDIGEKLGCGGAMEHLTRVKVGRFTIEEALTLNQVEELRLKGQVEEHLISVDGMFENLMEGLVKPEFDLLVHNGNPLRPDQIADIQPEEEGYSLLRVYDSTRQFMGIYEYHTGRSIYKPKKMFL